MLDIYLKQKITKPCFLQFIFYIFIDDILHDNASTRQTLQLKLFPLLDFQKLEREARICRKLQHPNIGKFLQ